MNQLPQGVVTFLMTDIEGSTSLWEREAAHMPAAMQRHDELIEQAVENNRGFVVRPRGEGDSRFAVFVHPADAVCAAVEMQRGLGTAAWPTNSPIRARAAVHTGFTSFERGDYYGSAVNRTARIRSLGHGGQTLVSLATYEALKDTQLPEGVTLRDLGSHQLEGLTRPERVFQLEAAGIDSDFPPLDSTGTIPTNLPRDLTEFVGRQHEVTRVQELLDETSLITLLAPGGAGKTRLAIEVGRACMARYPHGVFLVEMARVESPAGMAQAIAEAIGAPLASDEDPVDQLRAFLAPKTMLLIVDNLEHVTAGVSLLGDLLRSSPGLVILATSRVKLGLQGETVYPLPALETDWDDPDAALASDAVQLFTMAARRVDPSFAPDTTQVEALQRIVRSVQGLPLGIVLAAAWVDMLPVTEIAAEIESNLDFLETASGDVPERHRSIRAVFDYSWKLLDDAERDLFARLSVFQGGFTRETAELITDASLRSIASLVDKSLVVADRDRGRFTVHEMLRQYGAAELAEHPDREREAKDRHARCFGDVVGGLDAMIESGSQLEGLAMLETEIDNVRAAWRHCASTGDADTAAKLLGGIEVVHEVHGWFRAALDLFSEADGSFDREHPTEAYRLCVKAWYLSLLGDVDGARLLLDEASSIAGNDAEAVARVLQGQCLIAQHTGDVEAAEQFSEEMLAQAVDLGNEYLVAHAQCWVSTTAVLLGDAGKATEAGQASLDWCVDKGELLVRLFALYGLAGAAGLEGRVDDAIGYLHAAVDAVERLGYKRGRKLALGSLGEGYEMAGDFTAANEAFVEALGLAYDLGQPGEILAALLSIARVRFAVGDEQTAVEMLATVRADPAGSHHTIGRPESIHEQADSLRAELERRIGEADFNAWWRAGSERGTESLTLEVLAVPEPV